MAKMGERMLWDRNKARSREGEVGSDGEEVWKAVEMGFRAVEEGGRGGRWNWERGEDG